MALQTANNKRSELAHGSNPDSITVREGEAPRREETPTSYLKAEPESRQLFLALIAACHLSFCLATLPWPLSHHCGLPTTAKSNSDIIHLLPPLLLSHVLGPWLPRSLLF